MAPKGRSVLVRGHGKMYKRYTFGRIEGLARNSQVVEHEKLKPRDYEEERE